MILFDLCMNILLQFTMMRGLKPAGISDLWKSVNHVALVVSDIARSAAFYGGSLGMKQVGFEIVVLGLWKRVFWLKMGNLNN